MSQKFVPHRAPIIGVYSDYISITTSTTLTTTGLKFTATEPGLYRVTASALFSSTKPTQLRINQSYTGTSWYNLIDERSTENTSALTGTAIYRLETGGGFELLVAYSSASSNYVGMIVEKIG